MIIEDISLGRGKERPNCLYDSSHRIIYFDYTAHTASGIPKKSIGKIILDAVFKHSAPQLVLIIDSLAEGPCIADFDFLDTLYQTHPNIKIIHITSGLDQEEKKYQVITDHNIFFWPITSLWTDNFSTVATHHFIALARAPKPQRLRFINSMLNRGLNQWGHFSIGAADSGFNYDYDLHHKIFGIDEKNLKHFPTLLDGPVTYDMSSQYNISDRRITQALLNVVLETSYENLNSLPELEELMWRVPFLTEKTVKAFAIGQIPLILGPFGQVAMTRDLGFDLFDDIVDHSYDCVVDPYERIERYTNSLENFIKEYSIESLQSLKDKLMPRFQMNLQLAKQRSNVTSYIEKLQEIINSI